MHSHNKAPLDCVGAALKAGPKPKLQVIPVQTIMRKVCVCPDFAAGLGDKDHVLNDLLEREPIDQRWLKCADLSPVPPEYKWPPAQPAPTPSR